MVRTVGMSTIDLLLKVLPTAVALWLGVTVLRLRRELALKATESVIQEAWSALSDFQLLIRQWSDGVKSDEDFVKAFEPVFQSTLKAFHRARLVLHPRAVAEVDRVFAVFARMRGYRGNASMCRDVSLGTLPVDQPNPYEADVRLHFKEWRAVADEIDEALDRVHLLFQRQLLGAFVAWRWARIRRKLGGEALRASAKRNRANPKEQRANGLARSATGIDGSPANNEQI